MRIELCEDNGALQPDKKPTLVVLLITKDDGAQVRLPYEAGKTIAQLYDDISGMSVAMIENVIEGLSEKVQESPEIMDQIKPPSNPNTIEREDIVKCIKVIPREGNQDLKLNDEYRVVNIVMLNGRVVHYEVLDDKAEAQYRIAVAPEEIELVRKAPPKAPKVHKKDEIVKCECGEEFGLVELPDKPYNYSGTCPKCQKVNTKILPIPEPAQKGA